MLERVEHRLAAPLVRAAGTARRRRPAPRRTPRSPPARRTARPRSAAGRRPACRRRGCRARSSPESIISSVFASSGSARDDLGRRVAARGGSAATSSAVRPKMKMFSAPTCSRISMLAPSSVPIVSAPFSDSFMLPVPEASMPGGRDLLREVRRRHDPLRERHVVVGQEHHLELAARCVASALTTLRDVVDQLDDALRHHVAGRRLAREDHGARHDVRHRDWRGCGGSA